MRCGEKIAILRKENNLTQEQFAELLNVSRQAVSKWESCMSYPDTDKLIKISKLFSTSLDYLLKDEIENRDINQVQENNNAKKNYFLGVILTYLSFPPIIGFVIAIYNIYYQKKNINNKKMMILSAIGFIFSLTLTVTMIWGFLMGL